MRRSFEPDPVGEWVLIIGLAIFALGMSVAPFVGMWLERRPPACEVPR